MKTDALFAAMSTVAKCSPDVARVLLEHKATGPGAMPSYTQADAMAIASAAWLKGFSRGQESCNAIHDAVTA